MIDQLNRDALAPAPGRAPIALALALLIPPMAGTTLTLLALTLFPIPLVPDWPGIGVMPAPTVAPVPSSGFAGAVTTATLALVLRRIGPGPPALGLGNAFFTGTTPAAAVKELAFSPDSLAPKIGNDDPFSSAPLPLCTAEITVLVVARKGGREETCGCGGATGEASEMSASSAEPALKALTSRSGDNADPPPPDTARLAVCETFDDEVPDDTDRKFVLLATEVDS